MRNNYPIKMETEKRQTLNERCKIVVWMDQLKLPEIVQLRFKKEFKKDPPNLQTIQDLYQLFITTGSVWKRLEKSNMQNKHLMETHLRNDKSEMKQNEDISTEEQIDELTDELSQSYQNEEIEIENKKLFEWVTLLKKEDDEDDDSLSFAEINVHEGEDEDLPLKNTTCSFSWPGESFTTLEQNLSESQEKSKKDYFKCPKCFFTSNNTSLFRSHKKNCKEKRNRESVNGKALDDNRDIRCHTCEQCGKAYSSLSSLKMHKAYHSKLRPFACEKCDYRFFSEKNLKKHLLTHDKIKHLECPHCNFKCNLSGNMIIHARTHTGEKPYSCTECSYRTGNPSIIKRHLATHRKEISYRCRKCNYKTHKSSLLANHEASHTTEAQFRCYICQEELRNAYALRYHMTKLHSEQEVLECPFCDFRQKDKALLKIHIRRHTGEKPYGCPEKRCDFRAMRSQDLKKHLNKCPLIKRK